MDGTTRKVLLDRIEAKLAPEDENGCRLWLGRGTRSKAKRGVAFQHRGVLYKLHSVINPGMFRPRAVCGRRDCGNPAHWEAGDYIFKGRKKTRLRECQYGLGVGTLDRLEAGGCNMCGVQKNLCVDHDHETGAVRGILCKRHNTAVGSLGDSVQGLERAAAYLNKNGHVLVDPLPKSTGCGRDRELRRHSHANMTLFKFLYEEQRGRCACCDKGVPYKGHKVHLDHEDLPDGSKKVRGVLCSRCNTGLGQLGDNLTGVNLAIAYLERSCASEGQPQWNTTVAR